MWLWTQALLLCSWCSHNSWHPIEYHLVSMYTCIPREMLCSFIICEMRIMWRHQCKAPEVGLYTVSPMDMCSVDFHWHPAKGGAMLPVTEVQRCGASFAAGSTSQIDSPLCPAMFYFRGTQPGHTQSRGIHSRGSDSWPQITNIFLRRPCKSLTDSSSR